MRIKVQPVKKVNVSNEVFKQLKQMLLRGDVKPGEKFLSENELADAFGVSRMTARQAVQKLVVLGLLETRLGEGSFVKEVQPGMLMNQIIPAIYLSENSLLEVFEFRTVVEGKVAEIAANKATAEDIEELEEIWGEIQSCKEDEQQFARMDMAFHVKLAKISKNSILSVTYGIINDAMKMAMEQIVSISGTKDGIHYHGLILEAIKEANGEKARKIMTEHVETSYMKMLMFENNKKDAKI